MEYTDMERRILDMWPKFEDGCARDLIRRAKAIAEKEAGR